MVGRFHPQRAQGEVFERFQDFAAVLEENFFVFAVNVGEHLRVASRAFPFGRNRPHVYLQLKSGNTDDILQKLAQGIGPRLAVQLPIMDQYLSHRAFEGCKPSASLKCPLKTFSRARASWGPARDVFCSSTTAARCRPRCW